MVYPARWPPFKRNVTNVECYHKTETTFVSLQPRNEYSKLCPAHKRIVRTSKDRAPSKAKVDVSIVERMMNEVDSAGK